MFLQICAIYSPLILVDFVNLIDHGRNLRASLPSVRAIGYPLYPFCHFYYFENSTSLPEKTREVTSPGPWPLITLMQQTHFTDGHKSMDTRETDFYRLSMAREAKALNGTPRGSEHRNPVLAAVTPRNFRTSPGLLRSNGSVEWRTEENGIAPIFADKTAISPTKRINYKQVTSVSAQKVKLEAERLALEAAILEDHTKILVQRGDRVQ